MKKTLALLLALMMLLALLPVGTAFAEEPITLDVIICENSANTRNSFLAPGRNGKSFTENFEAQYPNVRLNLEVIPWDRVYQEVQSRIAAGNAPDILNMDVFTVFEQQGLLMPITDCCQSELFEDFFPQFVDQSFMDDNVWAVPDLVSATALFYNADILAEAGVAAPTTWAELESAAEAIYNRYGGEVYPLGVDLSSDSMQSASTFACFAWGNGGGFVDGNNNWALNTPANAEAVNFALSLVQKGYTNPDPMNVTAHELVDLFGDGKLAMVVATSQMPMYLMSQGKRINLRSVGFPSRTGETSVSIGAMDRLMAFRDPDAPDQEKRNEAIGMFFSHFYAPQIYASWVSAEGYLPAVKSAADLMAQGRANFAAWAGVLNDCKLYPADKPGWEQVSQGVTAAMQAAYNGADIQAELDALQTSLAG